MRQEILRAWEQEVEASPPPPSDFAAVRTELSERRRSLVHEFGDGILEPDGLRRHLRRSGRIWAHRPGKEWP